MVFHFNEVRQIIAKNLSFNPYYSYALEDLINLMPERKVSILDKCSSQRIARLHYHIDNNHDMEAKTINANVEFVRMGVLSERKSKDRKVSGMVKDDSLKDFLELHDIEFELKEVDRNSAIATADALDAKILGDAYGRELPPVSEDSKPTRNKISQMIFVSTWDLVRATMNGKFCGGLRNYASLMITLNRIFLEESKNAIDLYCKTGFKEKDSKIDELLNETKDQSKKIDDLIKANEELLGFAKNTNTKLDETNKKLDNVHDELQKVNRANATFVRMIANLAFSPKIAKDLLDLFSNEQGITFDHRSPWNGIDPMKMFFMFSYVNSNETQMITQVACCNFKQATTRLSQIVNRMTDHSKYIGCKAIAFIDKDVNEELALIEKAIGTSISQKETIKRFSNTIQDIENAKSKFGNLIEMLKYAFKQRHEQNVLKTIEEEGANAEGKTAKSIERHFSNFKMEALSWCQEFLDAYLIVNDNNEVTTPDLRKMNKSHTIDGITTQQGSLIRMNRCNFAKVQLKICIRDFHNNMDQFIETLSDSDDE